MRGVRRGAGAWVGRRLAASTFVVLAAAALATEMAVGAVAVALVGSDGPAVLAALGNFCVCLRFGATLLPGREPLISRYSRFDAGLPDADGTYTRRLTLVWSALLAGFALAYATAALASWSIAVISVVQPLTCGTLFLGEHVLRNRRFPEHGRATPLRTLRAIWLSHGAAVRHAA